MYLALPRNPFDFSRARNPQGVECGDEIRVRSYRPVYTLKIIISLLLLLFTRRIRWPGHSNVWTDLGHDDDYDNKYGVCAANYSVGDFRRAFPVALKSVPSTHPASFP